MKSNMWFRRHQKKIFVVLGVVVMITWYISGPFIDLLSGRLERGGQIYGGRVSSADIRRVAVNFQAWMPRDLAGEEAALGAAWEHLILLREARRIGLSASDGDVEELIGYRFWSPQGIDRAEYRDHLRRYNISIAEFEEFVRDMIAVQKLQNLAVGTIKVSEDEAWRWFIRQEERVSARYAELAASQLVSLVNVDEDEMRRFHELRMSVQPEADPHGAGYLIPEKIRVEYVMVAFDDMLDDIVITERQIRTYYEENRDSFALSQQPLPGMEAMTDEPVYMELDDVHGIIESELREAVAKELANEEIRRVDRHIAQQMDTVFGSREVRRVDFQTLPELFNVTLSQTDVFDERSVPLDLFAARDFAARAFRQPMSDIRYPRRPMETRDGYLIFQILEIQQPRASSFEEVSDRVRGDLRRVKARDMARELIASAHDAAKGMEDPEEAFEAGVQYMRDRLTTLAQEALDRAKEEGREITMPSQFVRIGDSAYFGRPARANGMLRQYRTGMAYNRGLFAQRAFELEEDAVGMVFEEFDMSAGYLLYVTGRRFPEVDEFRMRQDEIVQQVMQRRHNEAQGLWRAEIMRRADPSPDVRQLLARRGGWTAGDI